MGDGYRKHSKILTFVCLFFERILAEDWNYLTVSHVKLVVIITNLFYELKNTRGAIDVLVS